MEITDFLTPDRVILDLRARDKSHLIAEVARAAGRLLPALKPATIETALLAREQLGSTGLGAGFALPHARIEGLVRLAKPIDFDAIDGRQVRLVFVLLIPAEAVTPHVAALAAISRRFRDAERVGRLEKADSPAQAHAILADR
jgi:PTS system nitrogen regulatory IIA component